MKIKTLAGIFIAFSAIFLVACGGGGSYETPIVDASGVWRATITDLQGRGTFTADIHLSQTGTELSGTLAPSAGSCLPTVNFKGFSYNGSVVINEGTDPKIIVTASFYKNEMAGRYTLVSSGCGYTAGVLSAIKI